MASLKELSKKEELFTGGHRLCAGCGAGIIARQVMIACEKPVVVANATGCLEVASTIFPYTAWRVPWFHSAFENAAASISGIETAYNALKKKGKVKEDINFIAFGGDGGTYDIGLQALSGAMERGHRILYICYNNEAYMNTGVQRSSATPKGASTTTAPSGKKSTGKMQMRKDLSAIMVAHNIPYVAQTTLSFQNDLISKVQKALSVNGPSFMNIMQPCRLGWIYPPEDTVRMGRLAADTCIWPIYEVTNGIYKLNYKPKEKKPITEWLKTQGRFKHLFSVGNEDIIKQLQEEVDKNWEKILSLCNEKA
ncbi:MAG: pyruvate ferredoxin oxidoreductase [Elusimicrobia bacterium RIFOXYC2_FULL_34_12]|nr:MAG: pyruvate ferredoxin oxidoreductase [Elusimicrobia bacterium RIFOXYC2_FULL_34_12]HAM38701.1 pyruvate ferredoxin oxidoreductase [Elusimicrobiota bacterium]